MEVHWGWRHSQWQWLKTDAKWERQQKNKAWDTTHFISNACEIITKGLENRCFVWQTNIIPFWHSVKENYITMEGIHFVILNYEHYLHSSWYTFLWLLKETLLYISEVRFLLKCNFCHKISLEQFLKIILPSVIRNGLVSGLRLNSFWHAFKILWISYLLSEWSKFGSERINLIHELRQMTHFNLNKANFNQCFFLFWLAVLHCCFPCLCIFLSVFCFQFLF